MSLPDPAALPCLPPAASAARPIFPFTAIVGQEEMKLALILNVIDPKIGGVMIMGDRGTGKSTTIRALADLLPEIPVSMGARARYIGLQTLLLRASELVPCSLVPLLLASWGHIWSSRVSARDRQTVTSPRGHW